MKNIVVLGTGPAAMPVIRQTMRNTVIPSSDYKLIVVSPSDHLVWPIAMPRAVVPGQFGDDKVLYPLAPVFSEFPAAKFEFVHASATDVDPEKSVVKVGEREIEYHTLIVATGSSTKDGFPWKVVSDEKETKRLLHKTREDIGKAKAVAVIGGGVTGAETAGELGYEYSRVGTKDVYLIYNGNLPLYADVPDKVRKQVVIELERLNVKLVPNTNVTKTTHQANGQTDLELTEKDGSKKTITVGTVLPSTGVVPNTSFMPAALLTSNGTVDTDGYLRSRSHRNIFALGDAGSVEASKVFLAHAQATWLVKHLPKYFSNNGELPSEPYMKEGATSKAVMALTLGRSKGTGQMGEMKLPSIMIWWMKGRYLGTDTAPDIAKGKRTMTTVFEK